MIEKEIERSRLHVPSRVGHALPGFHAVLESEIEIHVLRFYSEITAQIQSAARHAVIRRAYKFAQISRGAAEAATDVEVEAIEILSQGGNCQQTKREQKQYSLTQFLSPFRFRLCL